MEPSDSPSRSELPSVTPEALRVALRQVAAGVTIVTAEHEGVLFGITATSFTSISLDPPIVMVSINSASPLSAAIAGAMHFAVHLLTSSQQHLAVLFAEPHPTDRFGGLDVVRARSGAPVLHGGLASIDCVLQETLAIGTHTVMFGRVVHVNAETEPGSPLVYYHRAYRRLEGSEPD